LRKRILTHAVARIRALLPTDWTGQAGERFRKTTQAISDFAEDHNITPQEVLDGGVELGRRKLEGLASHEYAGALKNFADAEKIRTETELQRRAMEADLKRRDADARKSMAEAHVAEISVVQAELTLLKQLKEAGLVLHRDANGNLTALSAPPSFDLTLLASRSGIEEKPYPDGTNVREDVLHISSNVTGPLEFLRKSVVVEGGATVTGNLSGDIVLILAGATVQGNVEGHIMVELKNAGRLIGNIRTAKIVIEDGAYFKGEIDIIKPNSGSGES
jgi:cytoskeletal protein CcmA (bactofilin family)